MMDKNIEIGETLDLEYQPKRKTKLYLIIGACIILVIIIIVIIAVLVRKKITTLKT